MNEASSPASSGPASDPDPLSRARPRLGDLLDEALAGVTARPTRLVLTTLGTLLGIAALVATVGIGQTAAGQVTERFDLAAATRVVVEPGQLPGAGSGQSQAMTRLPWDAQERAERLAGVAAAGTFSTVGLDGETVRGAAITDPGGRDDHRLPLLAASPGLFEAVGARLETGRFFDAGHNERGDRVVLLGRHAAERLGINRVDAQPTVFLGDEPYTVIGILASVRNRARLLDGVVMPDGAARAAYELGAPEALDIRTEVGAAQLVGRQVPIAIEPNRPDALVVDAPPPPSGVRDDVEADVNALFLVLGGIALLVGGLGIANVTLLSVLERVPEIGLRRALGAARRHIAGQFLMESVLVGFLGGLLGTALGVLATVGVSAFRDWTPLLDPQLALFAPLLGAVIGLVAGTYPAVRAATIEPITALRGA